MKRRGVVLLLAALSVGAVFSGCGQARTIRQANAALDYLDEAEEFYAEYQEGISSYLDSLEEELAEKETEEGTATVERHDTGYRSLAGSGAGSADRDKDAELYEEFNQHMADFEGDPDGITLHILDENGSYFDKDSKGFNFDELLLLFVMNDADHDVTFEVEGVPGQMSFEGVAIEPGQGCYFPLGDYMTEDGEITVQRIDLDGNVEVERTLWIAL